MKTRVFFCVALTGVAMVEAQEYLYSYPTLSTTPPPLTPALIPPAPTPAQIPPAPISPFIPASIPGYIPASTPGYIPASTPGYIPASTPDYTPVSTPDYTPVLTPAPTPTSTPTPAPTPDPGPWETISIKHDEVQPFAELLAVTISEKAALKFKPELYISHGCHPYPAVDYEGRTSSGLKPSGRPSGMCEESSLGSQVYSRSIWFRGVWAIMYAWYFPKESPSAGHGHRHDWESAVVWINNPAVEIPEIMGVSMSENNRYNHRVPPTSASLNGTRLKLDYDSRWPKEHALYVANREGDTQPLIMWKQLTENARRALNQVDWGTPKVPLNDVNFQDNLAAAWPFGGDW